MHSEAFIAQPLSNISQMAKFHFQRLMLPQPVGKRQKKNEAADINIVGLTHIMR